MGEPDQKTEGRGQKTEVFWVIYALCLLIIQMAENSGLEAVI